MPITARSLLTVTASALIAALCACSSIQGTKVTNETRQDVATAVTHSSLSDTQKKLFADANDRANTGDYDVTDKTRSRDYR